MNSHKNVVSLNNRKLTQRPEMSPSKTRVILVTERGAMHIQQTITSRTI